MWKKIILVGFSFKKVNNREEEKSWSLLGMSCGGSRRGIVDIGSFLMRFLMAEPLPHFEKKT
jgi:hypothetical protein